MGGISWQTITNIIPKNIWKPFKKWFFKKEEVKVADGVFSTTTKFTGLMVFIGINLSLSNQFVRQVEISCVQEHPKVVNWNDEPRNKFDDYCWNYGTFLSERALEHQMRGSVSYPGVHTYSRYDGKVIEQHYYKFVWFILSLCFCVAIGPHFCLKVSIVLALTFIFNVNLILSFAIQNLVQETDSHIIYRCFYRKTISLA